MKKSEEAKLVDFFSSPEGDSLGRQGDHDNLSPADTAIRAIRRLRGALLRVEAGVWDRLYARGPLSKEYAQSIARDVADALEGAVKWSDTPERRAEAERLRKKYTLPKTERGAP